ncbi:hypothetical protein [Paraburkholderia gardini]|uniref:hypothetical protein n=1 Tax=Paraburkholderia gardini TaxID=2823469 RepID=UPI001E3CB2E5|nr:hypothetical protein [Paraburkholderia gardini]
MYAVGGRIQGHGAAHAGKAGRAIGVIGAARSARGHRRQCARRRHAMPDGWHGGRFLHSAAGHTARAGGTSCLTLPATARIS